MKTTAISCLFCLALITGLRAQIAVSGDYQPQKPFVYESVSFHDVSDCEQVTIKTQHPERLTAFEFKGTDAYLAVSWGVEEKPEARFPMNFTVKPGKVKIRFKQKGQSWKMVEAELQKGKPLVINLEDAGVASPNG